MAVSTAPSPAPEQLDPNPLRWRSLLSICVLIGVIWILSDGFVIAIPTIARDIGGSTNLLALGVIGFPLGACLCALYGRLGDQRGNRGMVVAGSILFVAGSLGGGLVDNPNQLIIARVVEGVGGYAVFTCSLSLITLEFPLEQRAKALGARAAIVWAASGSAVLVLAVVVALLGWRWIFWLAIPVALLAVALTVLTTPEYKQGERGSGLDVPPALVMTASFIVLTVALTQSDRVGPVIFACLVVLSALLFAAFLLLESRATNPLVPPSIWRHPTFSGSIAVNFLLGLALAGIFYAMALYLQTIRGLGVVSASTVLLGATVAIVLFNLPGARLAARGRYSPQVIAGMACMAVGCALVFFGVRADGTAGLFVGLAVIGASVGIQLTSLSTMQVSSAGTTKGVAAGVVGIVYGISGVLGISIATALMQNVGRYEIGRPAAKKVLEGTSTGEVLGVFSGSVPLGDFSVTQAKTITDAFDSGVMSCAVVFGLLALAGLAVAVALLREVKIEQ